MKLSRYQAILCLISILVGSLIVTSQNQRSQGALAFLQPALDGIQGEKLLKHIKTLASDEFEGRAPGTIGEIKTVDYLIDRFKQSGLKPGNLNGTYIQEVPMVGFQTRPNIELSVKGVNIPINYPEDFVHETPRLLPQVSVKKLEVVFAGYGIVAPEYGWDDYKKINVRNKLVIVLSGEPTIADKNDGSKPDKTMFKGDLRTYYGTRESKYEIALRKGAAAILVITDPEKQSTFSIFQTFARMEGLALKQEPSAKTSLALTGLVTIKAVRRIFAAAGMEFDEMQKAAQFQDFKAVSPNATANISIKNKLRELKSRNVVARIEGSDSRLKNEFVIYSAHWDHLGRDENLKGDQIYNGAIDNAAGTAQLLEIAAAFARLGTKPKRSILFIATTAEEKGYLGSRYYASNPLYSLAGTVANINLDACNVWGKTKDLASTGYGNSTLDEVLEKAATLQGRSFMKGSLDNGGLYFGSDQIEFAKAGIPAVFPWSGFEYIGKAADFGDNKWGKYGEKDYHQVTDEVEADWDLSGGAEDAKWLMIAGYLTAQDSERPKWSNDSEFRNLRLSK
jgi:Zn-dependent M28 family amino/carboxypeptidase